MPSIFATAKQAALANFVPAAIKALLLEDGELVKHLASLPANHPQVTVQQARRTAIGVAILNHSS